MIRLLLLFRWRSPVCREEVCERISRLFRRLRRGGGCRRSLLRRLWVGRMDGTLIGFSEDSYYMYVPWILTGFVHVLFWAFCRLSFGVYFLESHGHT